jgi:hypothetical protein
MLEKRVSAAMASEEEAHATATEGMLTRRKAPLTGLAEGREYGVQEGKAHLGLRHSEARCTRRAYLGEPGG